MGILAELRERMLVNWTLPETPETDPTTTVTQRGGMQTAGMDVPQLPLGGFAPSAGGRPYWFSTDWCATHWGYSTVTHPNLDWTRNIVPRGYFTRFHTKMH